MSSKFASYALACALFLTASHALQAADVRISDSDERFRIKYGTYPPHILKAREAQTEQTRNRSADVFSRLDGNSDGRISRQEWKKDDRCTCRFDDHDRDGDNHISRSEWNVKGDERSGS